MEYLKLFRNVTDKTQRIN